MFGPEPARRYFISLGGDFHSEYRWTTSNHRPRIFNIYFDGQSNQKRTGIPGVVERCTPLTSYLLVDEYAGIDVNEKPRCQPVRAQIILELYEHDDDPFARVQIVRRRRRPAVPRRHDGAPGPPLDVARRGVHPGTAAVLRFRRLRDLGRYVNRPLDERRRRDSKTCDSSHVWTATRADTDGDVENTILFNIFFNRNVGR